MFQPVINTAGRPACGSLRVADERKVAFSGYVRVVEHGGRLVRRILGNVERSVSPDSDDIEVIIVLSS